MKDFFVASFNFHNCQPSKKIKDDSIKLIEPSIGRIVELEVIDEKNMDDEIYLAILKWYLDGLVNYMGAKYTITGNKIRIEFSDGDIAEIVRDAWK